MFAYIGEDWVSAVAIIVGFCAACRFWDYIGGKFGRRHHSS